MPQASAIPRTQTGVSAIDICEGCSLVAGARSRHRLLHAAWDITADDQSKYIIDYDELLGLKPPRLP